MIKEPILTTFEFPTMEVRQTLAANADFNIDWIEIRRNVGYVRGIQIGYTNGLVSPLMGGNKADLC